MGLGFGRGRVRLLGTKVRTLAIGRNTCDVLT